MNHTHILSQDIPKFSKHEINLQIFPKIDTCGFVLVSTKEGHNQEFYDKKSTFIYIILSGSGIFTLNDEDVFVSKGDHLSIPPNTRIYYKGKMELALITNPAWSAENEVETRSRVW